MQRVVLTAVDKWLAPSQFRSHIDRNDDRPFEALGAVDRNDFDRFAVRIQPRFVVGLGSEGSALPVSVDVLRQLLKTAHTVAACALHQKVEISQSPRGLIAAPRGKRGSHAQPIDRLAQQKKWRRSTHTPPQISEYDQRLPRQRMVDLLWLCLQRQPRRRRAIFCPIWRERSRDIEQFVIGETDERSAQQGAEC